MKYWLWAILSLTIIYFSCRLIELEDKNTKLINNNEKLISIITDTKGIVDKKNIEISNLRYEIEELKSEQIVRQLNGVKLEKAYANGEFKGYFISKDFCK